MNKYAIIVVMLVPACLFANDDVHKPRKFRVYQPAQQTAIRKVRPLVRSDLWITQWIDQLKRFENDKLRVGTITIDVARRDKYTNSIVEIGYGFTPNGVSDAIRFGHLPVGYVLPNRLTREQADYLLITVFIPTYYDMVKHVVTVPLTPHQHYALASFAYNLGESNLRRLVGDAGSGRLNDGNYNAVENLLPQYTSAGGVKGIKGLQSRRQFELTIWNQTN